MRNPLAALPLAAALSLSPAAASAQVTTPARDSVATISFSNLSFSDARLQINAIQTIGAGSSGTKNVVFGAAPSLQDYALSSTGAVGVAINAFTPPAGFDLAVTAKGAGSWSIAENFVASDDPDGPGPLYWYGDFGGLPALELFLGIGGLVDTGGVFGVGLTIPGDWSTTNGFGSTTGQYILGNLDPEWSIDTSFVYDPVAKLTRFHATNPAYEGADSDHPSPFLDVLFVGAATTAVPEPATWAMMIAGCAAIGFAMRQRRPRTIAAPV